MPRSDLRFGLADRFGDFGVLKRFVVLCQIQCVWSLRQTFNLPAIRSRVLENESALDGLEEMICQTIITSHPISHSLQLFLCTIDRFLNSFLILLRFRLHLLQQLLLFPSELDPCLNVAQYPPELLAWRAAKEEPSLLFLYQLAH